MANILDELKAIDLSYLSKDEAKEFTLLLEELEKRETQERTSDNFYEFVKAIWPDFIHGEHHRKMAAAFDDIASGKLKRLIINIISSLKV